MFKHALGIEAKSNISGFKGVVSARSEHLNGCNRYWIQPSVDKQGKLPDGSWFDEEELIPGKKKINRGQDNHGGFPSRVK